MSTLSSMGRRLNGNTHESLWSTRVDAGTRSKRLLESDRGDRSLNSSPVGQGAPRGCLVNESITTRNRRA